MHKPNIPKWFAAAVRLAFAALLLLTSLYCVLAYLPDTYFAFVQAPFQWWLPLFVRFHPYLYSVLFSLLSLVLWTECRHGLSRRFTVEFILFHAAAAVFFFIVRPFSLIENNSISYLWSLVLLAPIVWLGLSDYVAFWTAHSWKEPSSHAPFPLSVIWIAGMAVGLLYPGLAFLRYAASGRAVQLHTPDMLAWFWALLAHVLFALFVVTLLNLPPAFAPRSSRPAQSMFLLYVLLAWIALGLVIQRVILASIPCVSLESKIYAAVVSFALVVFGSGIYLLITHQPSQHPAHSQHAAQQQIHALPPAAAPLPTVPPNARFLQGAAICMVLLVAVYVVPGLIGAMDWNFLVEKTWAVALWIAILTTVGFIWPRKPRSYSLALLLPLLLASFTGYRLLVSESLWPHSLKPQRQVVADALTRHAYFDASFQAIRDLWAPSHEKPCDDLCQYLIHQTNIPASTTVAPVEVNLVEHLGPTSNPKPNIFIFVIDSLRQDYVSAYNPDVTFTPEIGKFAADSVVMRNSFTRYAGTTLSEPAIWSGAMLLHKQYIQPFHSVNSLEKLIETDNYQPFVSVDTVLRVLLRRSSDIVPLDTGINNWTQEDLCSTTRDVEQKISRFHDRSRPIFFYAQPQNVHGITLGHLGSDRQPKKSYPGFQPLVASELERVDGCFGEFIHYLKSSGLYDNSIIVLTADHGESLGEQGHKGHAMDLKMEIIRVPLIIHVPRVVRSNYYFDPQRIAFTIDVTPSLYYLLGHRPIINDQRFGRPLFTLSEPENAAYWRKSYLVVSSYGPIYGIVGESGQDLFVANAVDGLNQYFNFVTDPTGRATTMNEVLLAQHEQLTRAYVQDIARFYHFQYRSPTLLDWMIR